MTIICGDCLEVMKTFPDNHFSAIVTDPPYGLSFMGKGWDYETPGEEYWKECLRISKPGVHLLAMGGTRTFHRIACSIEAAGFEIRDCIVWIYGQGFPKSHNNFGLDGWGTALKPAYEPIIMAMKPLDGTYKQNAEKWGQAGINIDGCRILGEKRSPEFKNPISQMGYSKGTPNSHWIDWDKTKGRWPANIIFDEESSQLLGEPSRFFFIARNDRIDACQSPEESLSVGKKTESANSSLNTDMFGSEPMGLFRPDTISIIKMETRSIMSFPILNALRQTLIGTCTLECEKIIEPLMALNIEAVSFAENGCVSIHFQNDAMEPIKAIVRNVLENDWLNGEKKTGNIGTPIINSEEKTPATNTTRNILTKTALRSTHREEKDTPKRFFYCAKASPSERQGSTHPTMKPLSLMEYLIKLVMPPSNGVLLDPFAGSGTTILAAKRLGFEAIGIEKEPEYCEIARKRLEHLDKQPKQMDMF